MNTRRFSFVALCAIVSAFSLHVILRSVREAAPITLRTTATGAKVSAAARALRPNYPYSVIPGGAYSPAELRFVNQHDPLVRDHYSDFDLSNARLVVLTADRYQYASFRLKDHIFWTHNRLRIPKGEVLLTDGFNYARTRCGNRLSNTPKSITTALQPPDALLSLPPFRPELLADTPIHLAPAPPIGELAQEFPVLPFESPRLAPYLPTGTEASLRLPESWTPPAFSSVAPISPGYPLSANSLPPESNTPTPLTATPPSPPEVIANVPEPATLLLFGIALCISGWLLGRMAYLNRRVETRSKEPAR
jgi:PEP-CTERM motif